jgi:hypothetical protein
VVGIVIKKYVAEQLLQALIVGLGIVPPAGKDKGKGKGKGKDKGQKYGAIYPYGKPPGKKPPGGGKPMARRRR